MRLIDADELKANIDNWYALVNEWGQTRITLSHEDIIGKIDNQPTAEVVILSENVIGLIRAEIDEQYDRVHPYNISCAEGLEMALDIIDKYSGVRE